MENSDRPEEKRRFPRIDFRLPVSYQLWEQIQVNNTVGKDISLGGIGLVRDKYIAPQTVVNLELDILSPAKLQGRIVWSSRMPHSTWYRFGIEFLNLSAEQRNFLFGYIANHLTW